MKRLSETYKELGIAFTFPIEIRNAKGYLTYCEGSDDSWCKWELDEKGNTTYCEYSDGFWYKWERDGNGNITYFENSDGYSCKYEYDADGIETYYENSKGTKRGTPRLAKTCEGKIAVFDGIKYKLQAL